MSPVWIRCAECGHHVACPRCGGHTHHVRDAGLDWLECTHGCGVATPPQGVEG